MQPGQSDVARLEQWVSGKEGEALEFKEAANHFDFELLAKYCCALANEGGGRVVLGVNDKRPRKIKGSRAFDQPERTRKGLCERLPLAIDFEEIRHPDCEPGTRVLVFRVPSRPVGMPVKCGGRYWMRKEDSLVEMTEDRLREIFAEAGRDFSAETCPGATVAGLDPEAVADFRRRWIDNARRGANSALAERLATMSEAELLADADAVVDGRVTFAALVLFGTAASVARHLPHAEVVFEYRSSEASGPAQDRQEYRRGLFGFYDDLWNRINLRNDKQEFRDGLFVTPIATFDEGPVREAVLNAVGHRDYQLGGSVFIRQHPRRLEIDSPGGFPVGVTPANILERQRPRNRLIADILARCGLVERSGQGMNLMFEEAIRHGKPVPDFARTDQYQVGLTLHGTVQDPAFVRFVAKLGPDLPRGFGTKDWLVLGSVARGEKVPDALRDRVARLVDAGIVERASARHLVLSRRYYEFVGDRPAYTRRRGLDREQNLALLLNHIRANGDVGSKLDELCQVLPALPADEVRLLLLTLKRRSLAHVVGMKRAGRWVAGPSRDCAV
jgi:ATP-dependent DNA helicase RecG